MDADRLRALQAPLKARYREDSEAALITLSAEGGLDGAGLTCSVETGKALVEAGLHPATGGDGTQACSGDMLLQALVACAGVTVRAVATAIGVNMRGGRVRAEGDLGFPRHPGRGQGGAGRLHRHPPHLRTGHRRRRGTAGKADSAHRALLRGLPDAPRRAAGDHEPPAGRLNAAAPGRQYGVPSLRVNVAFPAIWPRLMSMSG